MIMHWLVETSTDAIRPAVIPPIQSESNHKAASSVQTPLPATPVAVPETKEGAKPAPTDGQGETISD